MSSTTSASPSPSSTSRVIQVEIPATTVLAIGLGFVGLVFLLLIVSLGTRIYRVRRRMESVRAAGQNISFSDAWQRDGGMFSFLNSLGGNALTIGAGGAVMQRGREVFWGSVPSEKERPVIWDVPIKEHAEKDELPESLCEPFALSSTQSPRYIDRATPASELSKPRFTLSLLISLPRDPANIKAAAQSAPDRQFEDDEQDWPELPEVIIGTTDICPTVYERPSGEALVSENDPRVKGAEGESKEGAAVGAGSDVQQLSYLPDGGRPARWERYDVVKWRIEGMR